MADDVDDLNYGRKKQPYSPDLHLKTAIREYEKDMFLSGVAKKDLPIHFPIRKSVNEYQRFLNKPDGLLRKDSEFTYGVLLNPQLTSTSRGFKFTQSLEDNTKLAKILIDEAVLLLYEAQPSLVESRDSLRKKLKNFKISHILREWFVYRNIWESMRDIMKDLQIKDDYSFHSVAKGLIPGKTILNAYFLIHQDLSGTSWLYDYNQVLMLSDTICSRFLSLLFCDVHDLIKITPMPTSANLLELYQFGDDILTKYGNIGYNHIKVLETSCVANYLKKKEPLEISKNYLYQLLKEAENEPEIADTITRLDNLIDKICDHPLKIFEIFGCFRHFGHPTVDELEGIKSLRDNSRAEIEIDESQLKKVSGAFNRMIILEFISMKKRWPKCHLSDECENIQMKNLVMKKPIAISEYDLVLSLEDWSYIHFGHEFQFDDFPDFTPLLSDTAISPYLDNWYSIFSKDLLNIPPPENIEESRRVLVEVLKRVEINCKEIRETIQSRQIPEKWKVVGLHSKERELKIKARLFAMLCLEIRLYFNMTEKNISEKIFPLIPYQTMTWTDAELLKVMLDLSSLHSLKDKSKKSKYAYVIISLDFNKFNQKWRKKSTDPIFTSIDELLGTPGLLTYSHEFFQEAFFYLSSNLCPPDHIKRETGSKNYPLKELEETIFESETTWLGQGGGCEGLRQKGWTAIIVSALVANAFDTGVEGQIIGQGDNQVIVASFKVPDENMTAEEYISLHGQELDNRVSAYLDNLKKITNGIGMDLKLQESWVSTTLLNYGKEIVIDGSQTSGSIKKMSRAFQDVSELYPSMPNRISSLFTTAQATSMKSFDSICPYFVALIDCLSMVSKECNYGTTMEGKLKSLLRDNKRKLDDHLKLILLLLPKECGGLPVIPFLNMQFRGHPDQFTSSLVWLKHLSTRIVEAKRILDLITAGYFISQKVDFLQLIQDPYSLNFKRPIQSSNRIKHTLTNTLREITQNQAITDMMTACNEDSLKEIAEYLSNSTPLNPRVLNEILRLSPDGSMLGFLSIFKDMRTMKQLLDPSSSLDLVLSLQKSDIEIISQAIKISILTESDQVHRWIESTINVEPKAWLEGKQACTTRLAYELREVSWGKPIHGVSIPHPSEQSALFLSHGDDCEYEGCKADEMIVYVVLDNRERPEEWLHFDKGPIRPYLGSGTSEKRSGPVLNYPKTEKALRAAQQLLRVRDWTLSKDVAPNTMVEFLDNLIRSRCDASEDFLVLTSGVNYGGSVQHRFSDVTSKHESRPGIRVNHHSRIMMTSDQLGKYARGKDNYPIVFQSLYLQALHKISTYLMLDPDLLKGGNIVFHQHLVCIGCLPLLNELPIVNLEEPPTIPTLTNCPLVFAKIDESLSNIPQSCIEGVTTVEPNPDDPMIRTKSAFAAALLIIGETSHIVTPLLHSNMKHEHRDGTLICLTLGFFLKVGMRNLFKQLAVVWVLDNLPQIVELTVTNSVSLYEASEILIDRYPDSAWEILKPFICLKEIQREARNKIGLASTSSEIFLTGKGLGYAISQSILDQIRDLLILENGSIDKKSFKIPFISTTPGISLDRAIFIWVNSCVLCSNWKTHDQLKILVEIGRVCITKSLGEDGIDPSKISILISNIKGPSISMHHALTSQRMLISRVGVEPWVMPQILPDKREFKVSIAAVQPKTIDQDIRNAIFAIMLLIGNHSQIHLPRTSITSYNQPLPTVVFYPEKTFHTRSDHMYRLVGRYSTAALKYSQIFAHKRLTKAECSAHLAEGAGGVARSGVLLLGANTVIYNSLITIGVGLNHRVYDYIPAELQDLEQTCVIGPTLCYQTGGDITKRSTISRYKNVLGKHSDQLPLVTCDAEFPKEVTISEAERLLISFLEIVKNTKDGTLIIFKTFCRIREILVCQIAIWTQRVLHPEIVVPRFSSHESSEIFLVGRKMSVFYNRELLREISSSALENLESLIETRNKMSPLARSVPTKVLADLYEFYNHLGISYNFNEAVHVFLNYSVAIADIQSNLLESISTAVDHCRMRVDERSEIISRFSRASDLSRLQKLMVYSIRQDSRELHLSVETMFNANILRALVLTNRLPAEYFIDSWILERKGVEFYTYQPKWEDWVQVYGRSFYKILGHLLIIQERDLDLPLFVRETM